MAFLLQNSIFIHIPKTGGQWVTTALKGAGLVLGELGVVHATPDEITHDPAELKRSKRNRPRWYEWVRVRLSIRRQPVVFSMVRHPLSWYQSCWAHRMDDAWAPINAPDWFTHRAIETWADFTDHCRASTFAEFVRKCTARYPEGFASLLFDSYTDGCTFVGRQERLRDDLVTALRLAGEDFQPEHLWRTPPRNVLGSGRWRSQCQYTPELIERVVVAEARAIRKFGYEEIPEEYLSG
jgi:hypothetical protein